MGLNAQQLHDELLAQRVDGARHDSDICPFCRAADVAAKSHASGPSSFTSTEVVLSGAPTTTTTPTTEGGTNSMSDSATITTETHEALLAKAISDATSATESALERKTTEAAELADHKAKLETEVASLKEDNGRLNRELDKAQVDLKTVTDEVAALKADIAAKDEQARLTQVASARTDQVKNLALFPDEYIGEKASSWAKLSDEDWADRIDEWSKARPAGAGEPKATETASAMTGTSGALTKDVDEASATTVPARRSVLGLS